MSQKSEVRLSHKSLTFLLQCGQGLIKKSRPTDRPQGPFTRTFWKISKWP